MHIKALVLIVSGILGFSALTAGAAAEKNKTSRPNIILIYGDDVGYGDFGCYGGTGAPTPAIDALARSGIRFTSAYASSATCTPSRYSLLTGEYAFRKRGTGILPGDAAIIIEPGRATLPSLLREQGYRTAVVGKWHLGLGSAEAGANWNGEVKPGPLEVGFDYSFIMAATADRVPCVYLENHRVVGLDPADPIKVDYEKPFPGLPTGVSDRKNLKLDWSHGHNMAVVNGIGRIGYMKGGTSALWKDEDMADTFTRKALGFIEREKKSPFFLYFALNEVHVPRVPNPRFVGKSTMGPRGDALVQFDFCVSEIVRKLRELDLLNNTLILVSSDNGPVLDDGYKDQANEKVGAHKPAGALRGGKYSLFDGGTRIPLIAHWPARIKPGVSDAVISQVDFSATFAALAGRVTQVPGTMRDSQNHLPALLGDAKRGRDSVVLHAKRLALREGDWKYIPSGKITEQLGPWKNTEVPEPGFLFNVSRDPGETRDLAKAEPVKLKKLRDDFGKIRGEAVE
jgi:arylsulfatase A-like enzyme